jgi:hypothetical protein
MLASEDRIIEVSIMFQSYVAGQSRHWRRSERHSARDLFIVALEANETLSYSRFKRGHAQSFVTAAVQRNRATEFTGTKEEILVPAKMAQETYSAFEKLYEKRKRDDPHGSHRMFWASDGKPMCQKMMDLRDGAPCRGFTVARIAREIHRRTPMKKVVVFAPDGICFDRCREALQDTPGGLAAFNDDTPSAERRRILGTFVVVDQLESDKTNPRVLLIPFSHAAGHNFQYVSCETILAAPLYIGDDAVPAAANEQQAIGRVFRSGQREKVTVHRVILVGPRSEETMDGMLTARNTNKFTIEAATSAGM